MKEAYADVIVVQDGQNKAFHSYMKFENAQEIQNNGGLATASMVNLRETPDRPIPDSMKNGESCITDILVRLEPNISFSVN